MNGSGARPKDWAGVPDTEDPKESLGLTLAGAPRDWSVNKRDAWIWGIVCGWDAGAMVDVQARHRWSDETVERLKRLHSRFVALVRSG